MGVWADWLSRMCGALQEGVFVAGAAPEGAAVMVFLTGRPLEPDDFDQGWEERMCGAGPRRGSPKLA